MFKPFLITARTLSAFSFRPYFSNSAINHCLDIMFLWGTGTCPSGPVACPPLSPFSVLLPGVPPPRPPVLWHPFPSFPGCDVHPPQKNPGLPKYLSNGKIPFSWVSLARIPSLGIPLLLGTFVLPPLQPVGLFCPEQTPSWKWFWKEFPSNRISFSSNPACPNWDRFLGKERAIIFGSWFPGICCGC